MINELYSLAKAPDGTDIALDELHSEYNPLPIVTAKAPCVRVWLAEDGSVCGLESLDAEPVVKLRKYGNNRNSFPAFNIGSLHRLTDAACIAELAQFEKGQGGHVVARLESWCTGDNDNWIKGVSGKVLNSLTKCPSKLLNLLWTGMLDSGIMKKPGCLSGIWARCRDKIRLRKTRMEMTLQKVLTR
ncbi:MAG: hypothetical protein LBC65_04595 [Oscillospiraceae bacterium]|jgi:hypothetical protein|nr:hypothetical protein [Oscillospiraceae bacterium]